MSPDRYGPGPPSAAMARRYSRSASVVLSIAPGRTRRRDRASRDRPRLPCRPAESTIRRRRSRPVCRTPGGSTGSPLYRQPRGRPPPFPTVSPHARQARRARVSHPLLGIERTDSDEAEEALGVRAFCPREPRKRRQPRARDEHGKAELRHAMQSDDERRRICALEVLDLVDRDEHPRTCRSGGLAHLLEQAGQVGVELTSVGRSRLWFPVHGPGCRRRRAAGGP